MNPLRNQLANKQWDDVVSGMFGGYRMYTGKIGTGIRWQFTGGLLGFG